MIWRCQIPIVAFFRALQPNSDRSAVPLEMGLSQARAQAGTKTSTGLIERFYRPFKHGAADGGTRLSGIMEREGRRWTALFYDGTAATMCSELTSYDTRGRFRMPIRSENGTFYDGTAALNSKRGFLPMKRKLAELASQGCDASGWIIERR
jgi:hypothetical protein